MKKNKFKFLIIALSLLLIIFVLPVYAFGKNEDKTGDIPEVDGVYDVLGHKDLKVRVFVHKLDARRPAPTPVLNCGLSDLDSTAVVDAAGWKLPSTFTYNLNPNSAPSSIGASNSGTIAANAFAQWTNAVNKVSIIRGDDTKINRKSLDGKNIVIWGSASGSALGVTYIWYNPSTGELKELDTILNNKFSWMWSGSSTCAYANAYDAQDILTHELGHWFGLDDEYTSDYVNNTMYGYGATGDAKANSLTTGDINGVKAIYN